MPLRVGSCLFLHRTIWKDKGAEPRVVEVFRTGYHIPFSSSPPLSLIPFPITSYSPTSIKGEALHGEVLFLIDKGAAELAPPSPGYYRRLFIVWKATGSWRPVIDLSHLMETNQSVLRAVQRDDWMISIDLKDVYLQVLIHPYSRYYLRFVPNGRVYQFKALCFGLSTAPQVFTKVMAPVSIILHDMGDRILRYLDDWLVLASSRVEALWARHKVLSLCRQLGIVVNLAKSHLIPSRSASIWGMYIESPSLRAFSLAGEGFDPAVTARQISVLQAARHRCLVEPFRSSLLSLPSHSRGGHLRMRSL